ncbi:MAG: EAL domain-containing protein, partial [Clostridia bacterium]
TEEMVGAEALVRWKRSNGIIMNPGQFIDLFEGNSRIVELDNYVLNVTCAYQREMRESGKKIVPVSVNFSRLHLFDENFPIFLKETVESYGLAHSDIEVEITETAAMRDTVIILPVIKQMREYGFKMEVDDFGSGYSSLNTIKDLPIDVIKIDRKFLISEANNTKVLAIINTIVKLSKELCITTVLEGVETAEQLEIARKCKVDIIQGYYYARPMDYSSYQELLVA